MPAIVLHKNSGIAQAIDPSFAGADQVLEVPHAACRHAELIADNCSLRSLPTIPMLQAQIAGILPFLLNQFGTVDVVEPPV
ncbi:MAG: hypothetical protein ABSG90_12410 [Dehalococcoidia bacterium]